MRILLICGILAGMLFTTCISCKKNKNRDFCVHIESVNTFIDTFKDANLRGLGIQDKALKLMGKNYYKFNVAENVFFLKGYISKTSNSLFFIPLGDKSNEYEFFNKEIVKVNFDSISQLKEVNYQGLTISYIKTMFSTEINDTIATIKFKDLSNQSYAEEILMDVGFKNDIVNLKSINCKNDTLVINFYPAKNVYYKNINKDVKCL